ncbi:MAG: nicotinate phosphoribosyltransferase [Acidimicrobiales bacterium]|jgi:nicotinate phosphoribosyltransferase
MNPGGRISALHTDRYELTMLEAAIASGIADHRVVFEVFARSLPGGRRYGVVAGTSRLIDAITQFAFAPDEIGWLYDSGVITGRTAKWLDGWGFKGSIFGYPEGEVYVPGSPVLTVSGSFGESVILETLVLSVLNFDSGVATTASRIVHAAGGRQLLEMGSRRTNEDAAVAAARAAYVAGFDATSNLLAGNRYGIPTAGTSAHAFTLAFSDETTAFRAQIGSLGVGTTLLVDTFDVEAGIARAVAAAGPDLGAVRIDSGDLEAGAKRARQILDDLGASTTRIVLSGDLDAHRIAELIASGAPVDSFGVGTHLVSGEPPGFVYKVVEVADGSSEGAPMRPVQKSGGVKATVGGRKRAWRRYGPDGRAVSELVLTGDQSGGPSDRHLQVPLMRFGEPAGGGDLEIARERCSKSVAELPDHAFSLDPGNPCIRTARSLEEAK